MRILMFTILVFFSYFLITINVTHSLSLCLPDQKSVLLDIRSQLTYYSSESTKLVLWDVGDDCCEWPGLSCNDAGYITTLDLSHEGSIIGGFNNVSLLLKLPSLSVLRLDGIGFAAPFPDIFSDFTNLTVLSLAGCRFSGTVPHKVFQVPTLQTIDLSSNEMLGGSLPDFPENGSLHCLALNQTMFSGSLPESIGNLRFLSHIDFTGCNFSGAIPASITKLTKLVELNLGGNRFSEISFSYLDGLDNLETLDLRDNLFSGHISAAPFVLPSLKELILSNNNFSGHMNQLQNVTSPLKLLDFRNNNLEGTIPPFFFQLQKLTSLDLSSNKFSGQMIDLQNLTSPLEYLDLSRNKLEGIIPSFIFQLQNLTSLDLFSNKFSGQMIDLQNVTSPLQSLDLSCNNLEETIPSFFFKLEKLNSLYLSSNKFSGQMIDLQNLTSPLEVLDLSNNNLEGTIPSLFFQLQNLVSLDLSSNKFNGTVHLTKFGGDPNIIKSLDFSNNNLVIETTVSAAELPLLPQFGRLRLVSCNLQNFPNFLKNQSYLQLLDLSNNCIGGEIPNWIWGIGNGEFYYLNLSHNHLTHMKEPMEYGVLDVLDLNSNMLSGKISRLPSGALHLDFSNNDFSMIPLDIGDQIPHAIFFSIAKNRVRGRLPTSWCHAANLEVLDLSYNALHGTIPSCLVQNNSNLAVMNLKGNRLSGEISQKLQHNCSLETLDLSQNLLHGQIPPSLVNCTKLKVLNLGNNRISDVFPCWLNKLLNLHILVLRSNHFHGSISCTKLAVNNSWPNLQVMDLSSNNFSGNLPADLFLELKAILVESNEANSKLDYLHFTSPRIDIYYQDSVSLSLKGQGYTIVKIMSIFTSIDFSSNQFEGGIPETIGELKLLYLLNISHNALTGNIPPSLENLKALEALDLSFNNLTGNIPVQLEILTFLEFLNLSYNHLVGRIPRSTQLDTFDASSFMGNKGLCGFQLNVSCTGIDEPTSPIPESEEKQSLSHHVDIYISVAFGFAAGLGGIFVPLLLSSKWRSYYNKMIDGILSKIFFQRGQERRKKSR